MATVTARILHARSRGIKMPVRAFLAARKARIPFYVACAFLMQETAGGENVFGHDPGNFSGAGEVTKAKYLAYKRARQAGKGMQGVGPVQLTWWEFQDQADALGGCWKPYCNMVVGFTLIHDYHLETASWHEAAKRFNGSEEYAKQMDARFKDWKNKV